MVLYRRSPQVGVSDSSPPFPVTMVPGEPAVPKTSSSRQTTASQTSSIQQSDIPTSTLPTATTTTSGGTSIQPAETTSSSRSVLPTGVASAITSTSSQSSSQTTSSTSTATESSTSMSVESSTTSWSETATSTSAWESSSAPPEWTSSSWVEPAPTSESWQPPAETWSSSSWSEPSSSSSISSSSWSSSAALHTTSATSSTSVQPTFVAITLSSSTSNVLPATEPTAMLESSAVGGTLTNSGHAVSSTGLITGTGKSEAANGETNAETRKVAGMNVGAFVGLLIGIFFLLIAGYFIADRWHKKKSNDSTPLWRHFIDKFRDKDPNDEKRPFSEYAVDPFDDGFQAPAKKRASSFFNSSSSSKYATPITPHENLAGRGNWPAPAPPSAPSPESLHPRASRYMPTSGRPHQSVPPPSAIEPARPESDEILANYHPEAEYLDDGPARFTTLSNKRKTNSSTMSDGSVYSVDSVWGNASEMPPTARSSFSFSPWRRSEAEPPVPAIPDRHASASSRLSKFRQPSYERLQDQDPPVRMPPRAAMAQTPVAVKQKPGFGEGGFVMPLGGFGRD